MNWSKEAWQAGLSTYERILVHPFVTELSSGALSSQRFRAYIEQDIVYMNRLAKSMESLLTRMADGELKTLFEKFSQDTVAMEQAMQRDYAPMFRYDDSTPLTEACVAYSAHERHCCEAEDVAVGLASLLPCYWIYREVGQSIYKCAHLENHPYADWISLYADEAFAHEVDVYITLCDELAAESTPEVRKRMTEVFLQSAEWEWRFWDDAYCRAVSEKSSIFGA